MSVDLEGIDAINKALILTIVLSLVIELAYLAFPKGLQKRIDKLDFKKGLHTLSYTGCTASFFALGAILTKAN